MHRHNFAILQSLKCAVAAPREGESPTEKEFVFDILVPALSSVGYHPSISYLRPPYDASTPPLADAELLVVLPGVERLELRFLGELSVDVATLLIVSRLEDTAGPWGQETDLINMEGVNLSDFVSDRDVARDRIAAALRGLLPGRGPETEDIFIAKMHAPPTTDLAVIADVDALPAALVMEVMAALDELHRAYGGGGLEIGTINTGSAVATGVQA